MALNEVRKALDVYEKSRRESIDAPASEVRFRLMCEASGRLAAAVAQHLLDEDAEAYERSHM